LAAIDSDEGSMVSWYWVTATPSTVEAPTSAVPVNDPSAQSAAGTYPAALVRSEVALPALPASIKELATRATADAATPLGQAEALVNWFRSGRFRYTLHPPTPPAGADPLVSFLTQSRAGTCEQFAGAFTVLARSLGLPTRLVVGFTAGRRTGTNEVTVRGADAHAWPQVYLGAAAGWVSFEPTPQQSTGEVAPDGVVGPTSTPIVVPPTVVVTPTTIGSTPPTTVPPTTTMPTTTQTGGSSPSHTSAQPGARWRWWQLVALGGLLTLLVSSVALVRRRAGRLSDKASPNDLVTRAETIVDRAFKKVGLARPPWQPPSLFVGESAERLEHRRLLGPELPSVADQLVALLDDAAAVAREAECAHFDAYPIDPKKAEIAIQAANRVRRGLHDREIRQFLLRLHAIEPLEGHAAPLQ
jgi:hypothetical protein